MSWVLLMRNRMRRPLWTSIYARWSAMNEVDDYERAWCGWCTARSKLVSTSPEAGLCDEVMETVSLCHKSCYEGRLLDSRMYRPYWRRVLGGTPETTIPCSWCGFGSGTWCESCDRSVGPASALCVRCDNRLVACRLCWAKNYVRGQGPPKVPLDAARRLSGNTICVKCKTSRAGKRCGSCKTMPYCSRNCQRLDWNRHKPVCAMLCNGNEVFCVYEWQQRHVEACLTWAVARGGDGLVRFYRCFGQQD